MGIKDFADKAKDAVTDAADKAKDVVTDAADKAMDVAGDAVDKTRGVVGNAAASATASKTLSICFNGSSLALPRSATARAAASSAHLRSHLCSAVLTPLCLRFRSPHRLP